MGAPRGKRLEIHAELEPARRAIQRVADDQRDRHRTRGGLLASQAVVRVVKHGGVDAQDRRRLGAIADLRRHDGLRAEVFVAGHGDQAVRQADDDVVLEARGTPHGARERAPERLLSRQQPPRPHVRLPFAAAERIVLVLAARRDVEPLREDGDLVLRENVRDVVHAVRRIERKCRRALRVVRVHAKPAAPHHRVARERGGLLRVQIEHRQPVRELERDSPVLVIHVAGHTQLRSR